MGMLQIVLLMAVLTQLEPQEETISLAPVPMPPAQEPGQVRRLLNLDKPCAATALYVLLRLSGQAAEFDELVARLGEEPDGVPATRMCEVAREFGLMIDPVKLRESDLEDLEGPWIAFCQPCSGVGTGIGHYAVMRNIHDGARIQLIDPPASPVVAERDRLLKESGWCRIALVPRPSWRSRDALTWLLAGLAAGACTVALLRLAVIAGSWFLRPEATPAEAPR